MTQAIITTYPVSDDANTGTWTQFPADGIYWDKLLTDDEDTTYIQCTAIGRLACNVVPIELPLDAKDIEVKIYFRSKIVAAGTAIIGGVLKIGGSYHNAPSVVNMTNAAYANSIWWFSKNPVTGEDWTSEEVNSIQAFGFNVTDTTPNIRWTRQYLYLAYTPTTGFPPKDIPALEALRNIEMSAQGRVYVDEEGNLKYESRYARNP